MNEDTINIVQKAAQLSDEQRVSLWAPHTSESMAQLKQENLATEKSLGIIRPDPGSIKLRAKRLSSDEGAARYRQVSLIADGTLSELSIDFEFSYHFTCAGAKHEMIIHDWEVQATYYNWKRRYGTAGLLERVRQRYETEIPQRNLHFVMGTMAGHRRTFIIIGMVRSPISPENARNQSSLL